MEDRGRFGGVSDIRQENRHWEADTRVTNLNELP